ncbi:MAG: hypothetical protein D6734_10675, partial [Candidatus Schekmanbacteria bacterium]
SIGMKNAYQKCMKVEEIHKRCIYFKKKTVFKCLGFTEGIKFPSRKEIVAFCLSGDFENCPVYRKKENLNEEKSK